MTGRVVAIHIAETAEAAMRTVDTATAEAGRGLVGDRYHRSAGTWSGGDDDHSPRRQATFIEREAVDAVRRDDGIELETADTRRNIVTEHVALNHLVGREFTVGEVRFRGVELCEPCQHVERVSGRAIRRPLVHRGGLNAEILNDGVIRVGDEVRDERSS